LAKVSTRDAFGCTSTRKLTMVDLAGSERVAKTGAAGETLEEVRMHACAVWGAALPPRLPPASTGRRRTA
jgi:hypothetical protein